MADLTEFLLARIAEDEAIAHAASGVALPPWRWGFTPAPKPNDYGLIGNHPVQTSAPYNLTLIIPAHNGIDAAAADHIARWDPARVLAECEASRRVVERQQHAADARRQGIINPGSIATEIAWTDALRLLALPYADHPDYREEWRP